VNKFLLVIAAFGILSSTTTAKAQDYNNNSSTSVNEAATISQPIRIYKNTDLNFGGLFSGISGGDIHVFGTIGALTIPPSGAPSGATTTSATYPGGSGPKKYLGSGPSNIATQVASFIVTGEPSLTYSISVSGGTSIISGSGNQMTITLDHPTGGAVNPAGTGGTIQVSGEPGTDKFTVGGTLKMNPGQASGHYSGSFNVTVCYN